MLSEYFDTFPLEESFKEYLYKIKWVNLVITCPFCNSKSNTRLTGTFRHHCNLCNTNHSLTTFTVMHNTKIDLRKWLVAIDLFLSMKKLSGRYLANNIGIDKKSAYGIIKKLDHLVKVHKLEVAKNLGYNLPKVQVLTIVLLIKTNRRSV